MIVLEWLFLIISPHDVVEPCQLRCEDAITLDGEFGLIQVPYKLDYMVLYWGPCIGILHCT